MSYYAITGLINAVSSIVISLFVYLQGRKEPVNITFALYALSVAFWSAGYFMWQTSVTPQDALLWCRVLMFGAIIIAPTFLHFILAFLGRNERSSKLIISSYAVFSVFLLLDFTPLFVRDVVPKLSFKFWPEPGVAFHIFLMLWIASIVYSLLLLFRAFVRSSGIQRLQIKYVFIGMFFGFSGGMTNYFLWYNIPIPPVGNALVILILICVGYAIVRYHLFNTKVVVAELFTFMMWGAVVFNFVLASTVSERRVSGSVLLVLVVFGVFLIQSVINEIKQRERSENLAKEVEAKASQLNKQLGEIERMNKYMVNREIKMVELKKENEDLKNRLNIK